MSTQSAQQLLDSLSKGEWIYGISDEISLLLKQTESKCHRFNLLPPEESAPRESLLREICGHVGKQPLVHSPFRCDFGFNISIGDNLIANYGLTILDETEVRIGNRVFIGPNVSIFTITHALLPDQRAEGLMKAAPVIIDDDVWICGNATILPGVTIGRGAVVGAGSVVTASIPAMTLVAGNPARIIRKISEDDRIDP
ncbi:MAG: sugar O-acetyltransferase [Paramuribaculum sp.]|nr:sugar O-acetyltransferase [Paramuribaculum sp.]